MYREYVLSTNPYSYWPLDETNGAADIMGRSTSFSSVTLPAPTASPPKPFQPLVPGSHSAKCGASTATLGRAFGQQYNDEVPFTIDGWFSPNYRNTSGDYGTYGVLSLGTNVIGSDYGQLYVKFPGVLNTRFWVPDKDQGFYFAATWTGTALAIYVNGVKVQMEEAVSGAAFTNTSAVLTILANYASHVCVYDRALTEADIYNKYMAAQPISHSNACANDNGTIFPMRVEKGGYYDLVLDQEFFSPTSTNINTDEYGRFTLRDVEKMQYVSEPSWSLYGAQIASGQYLYLPNAINYMGSSEWAVTMAVTDFGGFAGNEYIFSLSGTLQRAEFYVNSSGIPKVDVVDIAQDGTETSQTITFDTAVQTPSEQYTFMYQNGKLFIKTGASSTVLNTVSGQEYIDVNIIVDNSTKFILGAKADGTGAAVESIGNVALHNRIMSDTELAALSGYDSYWAYTSRASGYWLLSNLYENAGFYDSYLECKPVLPDDATILNAYFITDGHKDWETQLTTSLGDVYTPVTRVRPISSSVLPYNAVPGVDIDPEITVTAWGYNTVGGNGDVTNQYLSNVTFRAYTDRTIKSQNSESYISFSGDGDLWINTGQSNRFLKDKYDGVYFGGGNVGGVVVDPLVNGSTVRYTYRAFEFLMYIDKDVVNTGKVISFYDGSTERSMSINSGTDKITHNFNSCLISNSSISSGSTSIANMYNQWVHVYVQLSSQVLDRQVYLGRSYNGSNPVAGVGIQNFATYTDVLSTANKAEHYAAFLGRYRYSSGVIDSITAQENAPAGLYAPAWHTSVVPV